MRLTASPRSRLPVAGLGGGDRHDVPLAFIRPYDPTSAKTVPAVGGEGSGSIMASVAAPSLNVEPVGERPETAFSNSVTRYRFAAFHSDVLTLIHSLRVPDR
jgi:hypothetical protein